MSLNYESEPGGLMARSKIGEIDVAALLVTPDGRYLMQLRDDFPHLRVRNHWALFGGLVEAGETPKAALHRELNEELEFEASHLTWFAEHSFFLPQLNVRPRCKVYFEVPITLEAISKLTLHEGKAMSLFKPETLFRQPRVVPWDVYGIFLHWRRVVAFELPKEDAVQITPPPHRGGGSQEIR